MATLHPQRNDGIDRCEYCGHAISLHNDLGYCRVNKMAGGRGQCTCDRTEVNRQWR